MAVIAKRRDNRGHDDDGISFGLRMKAVTALVSEAVFHPCTSSRIFIDPQRNAIRVERDGARKMKSYDHGHDHGHDHGRWIKK